MKNFLIIIGFSFMLSESAYANSQEDARPFIQLAEKCYRGLPPDVKDPYSIPMSDAINFFNNSSGEAVSYLYAIEEAKKVIRFGQAMGVC